MQCAVLFRVDMKFFSIFFYFTSLFLKPCSAQQSSLMNVKSWAYQLQNISIDKIANNHTFELIVIDYSSDGTGAAAFTSQQITQIKNSGKKAIAYISIGEAEDYRDYWHSDWKTNPPSWLGPENPNWKGNYKVRFWYSEWQNIIFNYVNVIIDQGFDGIYLDIIDAYYYWMQENPEQPQADSLMIQFVLNIRNYIQTRTAKTFYMIPQNAEDIINSAHVSTELKTKYFTAINAAGVEDVFFYGSLPENNPFNPSTDRINNMQEYLNNGKQVFSIEYLTDQTKIAQYKNAAANAKFIPYVCTRALDKLFDGIQTDVGGGTSESLPSVIQLDRNFPNPFSQSTAIRFRIEKNFTNIGQSEIRNPHSRHSESSTAISLKVFDLLGREVATLVNGQVESGLHEIVFKASHIHSGLYYYTLTSQNFSQSRFMYMLR